MLPWEYYLELTEARLVTVAQLIALGRGSAVDRLISRSATTIGP